MPVRRGFWLFIKVDWIAIVGGFAVGGIVGMTGVGDRSLMTPLPLLPVFKLNPVVAFGIHVRLAAITKSAGSAPGIWIGAQLTRKMPEKLARTFLCMAPVSAGLKVIT